MRKIFFMLIAVVLVLIVGGGGLFAQEEPYKRVKIYAGFTMLDYKTDDMVPINASDWEKYGVYYTGYNGGGSEGRILLDFEKGEAKGYEPGINLGIQYNFLSDLGILLDGSAYYISSGSYYFNAFLGLEYKLIDLGVFYIGVIPKLGGSYVMIDLGTASQMNHHDSGTYTAPVILSEGTIRDGDALKATMMGFTYQALLSIGVCFGNVEIFAQGGWTHTITLDMNVKAGSVELDMDSSALVKNDYDRTQAGTDPGINSMGLYFTVGAAFRFFDSTSDLDLGGLL
ncbi:MAG: hypothetical protein GY754_17515 [bacterium]|nr:hypothetical protein [bacterium]